MRRRACDAHGTDGRPAAGPRGPSLRSRGLDSARDLSVPRPRDPVPCRRRPPDRPPAPTQPHRVDPLGRSLPPSPPRSRRSSSSARRGRIQTEAATVPPFSSPGRSPLRSSFRTAGCCRARWRWVAGVAIVSFGFTIGLKLFDPEPYPAPNEDITNPLLGNAVGEFIVDTGIWIPFAVGVLASLFAGALAVILRFRRSVGVERLQMKWLVWGASLIALVLPLDIVMSTWFGGGGAKTFALLLVAQFALVAAIGIAVVRYRLYAIERARQSHARLRDADAAAPRGLRGDHRSGWASSSAATPRGSSRWRRSSWRLRSVPCARGSGSRRPPVPPRSVRGCSAGSHIRGRRSRRRSSP